MSDKGSFVRLYADEDCAMCFDPPHPGRLCSAPDMPWEDENGDLHDATCRCPEYISMEDRGSIEVRVARV